MNKKELGKKAEEKACEFLKANGLEILFRNWYSVSGELDIVALKDKTIHIVEVRCRKADSSISALESVNHAKLYKVLKAGSEFLYVHGYMEYFVSVDIVACTYDRDTISVIGWYENVTG